MAGPLESLEPYVREGAARAFGRQGTVPPFNPQGPARAAAAGAQRTLAGAGARGTVLGGLAIGTLGGLADAVNSESPIRRDLDAAFTQAGRTWDAGNHWGAVATAGHGLTQGALHAANAVIARPVLSAIGAPGVSDAIDRGITWMGPGVRAAPAPVAAAPVARSAPRADVPIPAAHLAEATPPAYNNSRIVHYINEAQPRVISGGRPVSTPEGQAQLPVSTPAEIAARARGPQRTPEMQLLGMVPQAQLGHAIPAMIAASRPGPRVPENERIMAGIRAIHESTLAQALAAATAPAQTAAAYQGYERALSPYALRNPMGSLDAMIHGAQQQ